MEYHEDVINFNEYGWIYIIGVVLIIFLVLGCFICLCRLGEDKAIPAASKGYQVSNIDKLESTRMFSFPLILQIFFVNRTQARENQALDNIKIMIY